MHSLPPLAAARCQQLHRASAGSRTHHNLAIYYTSGFDIAKRQLTTITSLQASARREQHSWLRTALSASSTETQTTCKAPRRPPGVYPERAGRN